MISNKYSDWLNWRQMVHYSTHLSAPLNELCTIFRIEGHSEKSCIRLLTLERLRRFTEFVFHRMTPCLSSARRVIVHERIYSIRRCYKSRPTSSRQPPRATVATSHSLWRVSLRQVTMLPSYLRASFLSKQRHLEAVFAANKLHRSARIMLKFESNARGC